MSGGDSYHFLWNPKNVFLPAIFKICTRNSYKIISGNRIYCYDVFSIVFYCYLNMMSTGNIFIECIDILENERIRTQGRPVSENLCVK